MQGVMKGHKVLETGEYGVMFRKVSQATLQHLGKPNPRYKKLCVSAERFKRIKNSKRSKL
jgi:hypothetical protein